MGELPQSPLMEDPSEGLMKRIRELEESHANLKEEMEKILEERERILEGSSQQQQPSVPLGRSQSMSPGRGSHHHPPRPMRTASDISQNRYVSILESMGQAVYMFTPSAEVTYWNRMAERLYGWSEQEATGRNIVELVVDNASTEIASKIVEKLCVGESWVGQFPLKKKSGEVFPAMITNTPLFDEQGQFVGSIGVSSDARPFMKQPQYRNFSNHWQQPWQIPFASTLSNLATKILSHLRANPTDVCVGPSSDSQKSFSFKAGSWMSKKGIWPWAGVEDAEIQIQEGEKINEDAKNLSNTKPTISFIISNIDNNVNSSSSTASSSSTTSNSTADLDTSECEITWDSITLQEQIGQGSYATVYRGVWCGVDVAVKLFPKQEFDSDIEDFKKEVAIMRRLRHPNVLLFMGAITSPDHLCIITELMPRGSLFRMLQRKPTGLDYKRKLNMALDVARGMNYLHHFTPPILHRDLKSTNLLVDRNMKVKVGDFSLSRLKHSAFLAATAQMGTSQWMAPEVLRSEPSNEKSDVYSFGVILWELASEEIPWSGMDALQVVAVVGFMDKRLRIPDNVDPNLVRLIEECWQSDCGKRPSFEGICGRIKDIISSNTKLRSVN